MKSFYLLAAAIAGVGAASSAFAGSYSDGFEAATINSFWAAESPAGPGTATLSAAQRHGGSQSLQLAQSSTSPYSIGLTHDFGSQVTGSVSVWIYNGGTPNASLGVSMDAAYTNQAFIEWHQDNSGSSTTYCGPYGNSCFQGRVVLAGTEQPRFLLPAATGWHLFELIVGPSGLVMKVDGTQLGTVPAITSFRYMSIDNWGGFCASCAPNTTGIAWFDDFNAAWTSTSQPPVAVCRDQNAVVPANSCSVAVSVDGGSYDPAGGRLTLAQAPPGPYAPGVTSVQLTVENSAALSSQCSATVTVADKTPPVIQTLSAKPDVLTPPNNRMVPVGVAVGATDNCGAASCRIVSVTSNQPVSRQGDWQVTGDLTLTLRASLSGKEDDDTPPAARVYTITVQCKDGSGNLVSKTVTVTVPARHEDDGGDRTDRATSRRGR